MQHTIRKRILPALWPAVIAVLLAVGLIMPVFHALQMTGAGMGIAASVLTACCCMVAELGRKTRRMGLLLVLPVMLALMVVTGALGRMLPMFSAVLDLARGNMEPLRAYGTELALLAGCVLTIVTWLMSRQSAGFYPALSMMLIAMLIIWFSAYRDAVWLFAPALVALCVMFARATSEDTPVFRMLAVSTLAVLLALAVSPALQIRSKTLENFAENLRTFITDSLFFTETRTVYSIQVDGYKPLGNRLGGPVEDSEERPVMMVEAPAAILLRGTIYNEYTGLNWVSTLSTRRYLYADPRNRVTRADTMDEQRPGEALRKSDLFRLADIKVTMQSSSASTLFAPLRSESLSTPMALVPYFNLSSEVFITRDLQAGDTYSFSAPIYTSNDSRLPDLIAASARESAETRDMSSYLYVHDLVSAELPVLVQSIVEGASSDYEAALAIQNYLRTNCRYTLTPDRPPNNMDFVSYFLMRSKEGYCTYFASAMAVMSRIAGLPSRYVEGYLVQPRDGLALVTNKNAHAWAEIYFEGFGWVPFDATPPASVGGPRQDESSSESGSDWQNEQTGEQDDPAEEEEQEVDPDQGGGGENASQPEQVPEDTSAEEQAESEDDTQSDPEEDSQTNPNEDNSNDEDGRKRSFRWLWLLLALLAVAAAVWRVLSTRPEQLASRHTSNRAKLLVWYRALLGLLESAGMPAKPFETPAGYAQRLAQGMLADAGFAEVAEVVAQIGYGHHEASADDVALAARCYRTVHGAVSLKARVRWMARRALRGIGSIMQVP